MKNDPQENQDSSQIIWKAPEKSNTSWAIYNGDELHIDDIPKKGLNGYLCPGCKKPVMAIVLKEGHQNHFKHHSPPGTVRECYYNDETFRHKKAKDLLVKHKKVRLPGIYKYSEDGKEKILLKKAVNFSADHVEIEKRIYFNEKGEIVIEPKLKDDDSIIQPDIIFYKNKKPVLLIEIRATHKVDDEKRAKLRALKIDTIEITIPNCRESEIGYYLFNTTSHTIWLYNNQENKVNYDSLTQNYSNRIRGDFKHEASIYAESKSCRKNRIRDLIRRIGEFSQSDEFRASKQSIEKRIEEEQKSGYDKYELEKELRDSIRKREREVKEEVSREFESEEKEFQKNNTDLEARYKRKRTELTLLEYESEAAIERRNKKVKRKLKRISKHYISRGRRRVYKTMYSIRRRRIYLEDEVRATNYSIEREFEDKSRRREREVKSVFEKCTERENALKVLSKVQINSIIKTFNTGKRLERLFVNEQTINRKSKQTEKFHKKHRRQILQAKRKKIRKEVQGENGRINEQYVKAAQKERELTLLRIRNLHKIEKHIEFVKICREHF